MSEVPTSIERIRDYEEGLVRRRMKDPFGMRRSRGSRNRRYTGSVRSESKLYYLG